MANTDFRSITLLTGGAATFEDTAGDNSVVIQHNADIAANITYNLPTTAGSGNFLRYTNATNQLSWEPALTENTGENSLAIGTNALANIGTSMSNNVALGIAALQDSTNVVGTANNTALGFNAASNLTSAARTTALGSLAIGTGITTGTDNTAIGYQAGLVFTSGVNNVAIGSNALDADTTGSSNIAIGKNSIGAASTTTVGTGIGYHTLLLATGANNTAIGHNSLDAVTSGSSLTGIGTNALTTVTANSTVVGVGNAALTTGTTFGTAIGFQASTATSGAQHVTFGYQAGAAAVGGGVGTSIGYQAGYELINNNCVSIGYQACYTTSGVDTTGVGYLALRNNEASSQTAVGTEALFTNTTGANNTAIGYRAMYTNLTHNNCAAVGYQALNLSVGDGNVAIGYLAGSTKAGGFNNVCIGISSDVASTNSQVAIGNAAVASAIDDICLGRAVTGGTGGFFVRHRVYAAVAPVAASWNATTSLELIEDTSSERYKTNIRDYIDERDSYFDKIRPRWYKPKEGGIDCVGMIAEELYELYPEYVALDIEKIPGNITYQKIITLLIEKIQKLRKDTIYINEAIGELENNFSQIV